MSHEHYGESQESHYDDESILRPEPTAEPFGRYEWFFLDTNAPGCEEHADRIFLRVTHESTTHIVGDAVHLNGVLVQPIRQHRIDKRVIDSRGHWHPATRPHGTDRTDLRCPDHGRRGPCPDCDPYAFSRKTDQQH